MNYPGGWVVGALLLILSPSKCSPFPSIYMVSRHQSPKERPNILFITSDEMRGDAPGFMGNPDCLTPCLDKLASEGVCFRNHFAVFPKCVPSRISMLTGRYAHTDGHRTVKEPDYLPKGRPNLVSFLRQEAGYETAVFGLNHVWDNDWFYHEKGPEAVVDYHSFSSDELEEIAMREARVPALAVADGRLSDEMRTLGHHGSDVPSGKFFHDENRIDQAIHYLRDLRDREKPFYLQVNLSNPHPPYGVREPYYSMYDRSAIRAFPYTLPKHGAQLLEAQRLTRTGSEMDESDFREFQATYYGMCSFVDSEIGRLLEEMDRQQLRSETYVVFCSDHGDYAGQYGLIEKWDTDLRDCLLRVPMTLAGPGIESGSVVDSLSEHVDILPTILELTGLTPSSPEWNWHGESLIPLMGGEKRKAYVYADGGHEAAMRSRFNEPLYYDVNGFIEKSTGGKQITYSEYPNSMARAKMIRSDEWKLIVRETGDDELYHVASDPYEMDNLIEMEGTAEIVAKLQRQLLNWCLRTDPDYPFHPQVGA